jgi:NTE family protein
MRAITLVLLLLGFGLLGQSQEVTTETKDLKVGLVLSGGGAKGLAHIGAMKVIEEAGIEIDYIGGTSMGAIIGALYASGYSASELDSIAKKMNFGSLIQDNLPRNAKTFYEKEDAERYALTLPFDGFKISIPPAYSGGQNIYHELVRLLYPVKDVQNFNDLPTPFLCIATNVETGEEVVLRKGYLPEAIKASGTLPSLFEPMEMDNKILIDGGVVNNYPLDKVYEMGADVVIGIDVQHELDSRENLSSATDILLQINKYHNVADMQNKSKRTEVYIKPKMEEYGVLDFDKRDAIISEGEIAAKKLLTELKALAESQKEKKKVIKKRKPTEDIYINRLVISGKTDNYSRGYIKGKLRFNLGEKISFDKLQQGISNLLATGNFEALRYKLLSNGEGEDLRLQLQESKNKTFLRLGAHYDNLYKSGALINLTRKNFITRDDVASLDFIIGDNLRYNFQYYIDKGRYWSFGLNSRYNEFEKEIDFDVIKSNFDVPNVGNVNNINLAVSDLTNQLYLQTVWKEEFAFTTGLEHKYLTYNTKTLGEFLGNDPSIPSVIDSKGRTNFERGSYYSVFGQLLLDTYDDKYYPNKGLYFNTDFHFYVLSSDFNDNFKEFSVTRASLGSAFSVFKDVSVKIDAEAGFKLGTSNVTTFDFILGGYGTNLINNFVPFVGYDFLALPGNSFVKTAARIDFELTPKNHVLLSANFANVDDDLFRTAQWFEEPSYTGYGVGYGHESFLGPLEIHYNWSPEIKEGNFFFSIGYWF